jgi:hypothetical protein
MAFSKVSKENFAQEDGTVLKSTVEALPMRCDHSLRWKACNDEGFGCCSEIACAHKSNAGFALHHPRSSA